jgi:hypothetical protein
MKIFIELYFVIDILYSEIIFSDNEFIKPSSLKVIIE